MNPMTRMQRASRVYIDRKASRAKLQYAQQETPYGNETVPSDEEVQLWNTRAPANVVTPEMEQARWQEAIAQKMPYDMALSYVGLLLYPARERLMKSGERYLDAYEQAKYADRMAKRSAPQPAMQQYGDGAPTTVASFSRPVYEREQQTAMPTEGGY